MCAFLHLCVALATPEDLRLFYIHICIGQIKLLKTRVGYQITSSYKLLKMRVGYQMHQDCQKKSGLPNNFLIQTAETESGLPNAIFLNLHLGFGAEKRELPGTGAPRFPYETQVSAQDLPYQIDSGHCRSVLP